MARMMFMLAVLSLGSAVFLVWGFAGWLLFFGLLCLLASGVLFVKDS